jgi:hypothetical protein
LYGFSAGGFNSLPLTTYFVCSTFPPISPSFGHPTLFSTGMAMRRSNR